MRVDEGLIEAVTVCHNTPDLLLNAVSTLRKHHDIPVIIVDGSDDSPAGKQCTYIVRTLCASYRNVHAIICGKNIGHGDGMHAGIHKATMPHVLVFDTDILVKKPVLQIFEQAKYYAQGEVVYTDSRGRNTTATHAVKYVHPYFALINKVEYLKYPRFRNRGAPCIDAMLAINTSRKDMLIGVDLRPYVTHLERGTRNVIAPVEQAAKYHLAPNLRTRKA